MSNRRQRARRVGELPAVTDDELIASFENCRLRNKDFHHVDHVRMGYLYLSRLSPI